MASEHKLTGLERTTPTLQEHYGEELPRLWGGIQGTQSLSRVVGTLRGVREPYGNMGRGLGDPREQRKGRASALEKTSAVTTL